MGVVEEVLLARHGQTEWNWRGRRQGQLDSPLTDAGRGQAIALGRFAASFRRDRIFASPLGRALTTAEVVAQSLSLDVCALPLLAEVHHGAMAGLSDGEIERRFPGELGRRANDLYHWTFPGGESYADADRRAALALSEIERTGARRPVIISHEMVGRMLLRNLIEGEVKDALRWSHPNHVVLVVDPNAQIVTRTELGV